MDGILFVIFICFGSASGVVTAPQSQTTDQGGPTRRGSASKEPPRLKKFYRP